MRANKKVARIVGSVEVRNQSKSRLVRFRGAFNSKSTKYTQNTRSIIDSQGRRVIRITADFKENERKIAAFTQDKMEQWYRETCAIAIHRSPVGGAMWASAHSYAGAANSRARGEALEIDSLVSLRQNALQRIGRLN